MHETLRRPAADLSHAPTPRAGSWARAQGLPGALRAHAIIREYRRGEAILPLEPRRGAVCFVEEGLLRIFRPSPAGGEVPLGLARPGEFWGEVDALVGSALSSRAEALIASRLCCVPRRAFLCALHEHTGLVTQVTQQLGHRLARAEQLVEDLSHRTVLARLARVLLELGSATGTEERNGVVATGLTLTQADLAALVGTTRQSVNTCLRQLQQQAVVGPKGKPLRLLDTEALRRAAEGEPLQLRETPALRLPGAMAERESAGLTAA